MVHMYSHTSYTQNNEWYENIKMYIWSIKVIYLFSVSLRWGSHYVTLDGLKLVLYTKVSLNSYAFIHACLEPVMFWKFIIE